MSSPVKKAAKKNGGTSFRRDAHLHKDGARCPGNSRSQCSSSSLKVETMLHTVALS